MIDEMDRNDQNEIFHDPDDDFHSVDNPLNATRLNESLELTEALLKRTFNDHLFIEYIHEMVLHANLNDSESAFVAWESNGKPQLSTLEKSPRMKSDRRSSYSVNVAHLKGDNEYPMSNIYLQLHSHPIDKAHGVSSWEYVCIPSDADINIFEHDSLRRKGIIEGVVAPDKGNAKILLFQMDPNTSHNLYYQTFEYGASIHTYREMLTQSGIRSDILTLPARALRFPPEELAKLSIFATKV